MYVICTLSEIYDFYNLTNCENVSDTYFSITIHYYTYFSITTLIRPIPRPGPPPMCGRSC